jgi:hypothetical protein
MPDASRLGFPRNYERSFTGPGDTVENRLAVCSAAVETSCHTKCVSASALFCREGLILRRHRLVSEKISTC